MEIRKPPLSPACFRHKGEKIDWRMVQTAKWEEWIRTANFEQIREVLRHLVSAHLDEEEVSRFRGPALHRLLELTQKSAQLLTAMRPVPPSPEAPVPAPHPCHLCHKQFLSEEYLRKHTLRRHSETQQTPPATDTKIMQDATAFLQNEIDRMRAVSEKQLEEAVSGLQYLLEKADRIKQARRAEKLVPPADNRCTLELIQELSKSQRELLEYDTRQIQALLPPVTPVNPEPVKSPRVTMLTEETVPMKPAAAAVMKQGGDPQPQTDDLDIEIEVTESSESHQEVVAAAKLIGFDLYKKPEYRFLAEELAACPVSAPWVKVDTGVAMTYRNAKTMETSLFHPKLESFQLRYHHFERIRSIGRELRSQLLDQVPKVRSFEDKYRGRLLHYFQHSPQELQSTRTQLSALKGPFRTPRTAEFFSTKESLRQELDRLAAVVMSDRRAVESTTVIEESEKSEGRAKATQGQEALAPPQQSKASTVIKPLVASIVTLKVEKESGHFSRFFKPQESSVKRVGTKIGEMRTEAVWEFKSMRAIGTIHGLLSTPESALSMPVITSSSFIECDLLLSVSTRSNGLPSSIFYTPWRRQPKTEEFEITMEPVETGAVLQASSRFTRL